jgi:hypothetical protein
LEDIFKKYLSLVIRTLVIRKECVLEFFLAINTSTKNLSNNLLQVQLHDSSLQIVELVKEGIGLHHADYNIAVEGPIVEEARAR